MKIITRNWKKITGITLVVLLIALAAFSAWAYTPPTPMPQALASLQSDAMVKMTLSPWIIFFPTNTKPSTGLIFYPGGRVDDRSYAPTLHRIAEQGYLVIVPPMPFNLAVFSPDAANAIISHFPEIKTWVLGGHSLGGAMAAEYAYRHLSQVSGLVLWASYPPDSDNLSNSSLKVLSLSASMDGLATTDKINHSRLLLPADTVWTVIQGGNHAQFGWYGPQSGDLPADISRVDQQEQVFQATLKFLKSLDKNP
jgi:hypothetical protein